MLNGIAQEIAGVSQELLREWSGNEDEAFAPFGGIEVHNDLCVRAVDQAGNLIGLVGLRVVLASVWAQGVADGIASERRRISHDALEGIPTMEDNPDAS